MKKAMIMFAKIIMKITKHIRWY